MCDHKEEPTAKEVLAPSALASKDIATQTLHKHHLRGFIHKSAFDLLIEYLAAPDGDQLFRTYASAAVLGMLKLKESGDAAYMTGWIKDYGALLDLRRTVPNPAFKKALIGIHEPLKGLHVYACLPANGVPGGKDAEGKLVRLFDEKKVTAVAILDDQLIESQLVLGWRGFLYISNLLQFIHKALLATESGLTAHAYDIIDDGRWKEAFRRHHNRPEMGRHKTGSDQCLSEYSHSRGIHE